MTWTSGAPRGPSSFTPTRLATALRGSRSCSARRCDVRRPSRRCTSPCSPSITPRSTASVPWPSRSLRREPSEVVGVFPASPVTVRAISGPGGGLPILESADPTSWAYDREKIHVSAPNTSNGDMAAPRAGAVVLEATGLRIDAPNGQPIVEDVSLQLQAGKILGIVGESGSGKTTTALALLGYTQGGARLAAGRITVHGREVDVRDARALRTLRGRMVSYVPQNPGTSLNPSMRIGDAIGEMVRAHRAGKAPGSTIADALERVGLPGTSGFQRRYPHQLSGGQQQRLCISVSLVCEPPVVVLDEPTTGLDVVTQARILEELTRLCADEGLAMAYVTHDLAVVAQIADRIAVMYAGRIVEQGPAREVLRRPRHPYTRGLLT